MMYKNDYNLTHMNNKPKEVTTSNGPHLIQTDTEKAHSQKPMPILSSTVISQAEGQTSTYEKNKAKKIKELLDQI